MKLFTIKSPSGQYWQAIDDMNSTESWGEGYFVWDDREEAVECLEYHIKHYPSGGYRNWKIVNL